MPLCSIHVCLTYSIVVTTCGYYIYVWLLRVATHWRWHHRLSCNKVVITWASLNHTPGSGMVVT